MSMWTPDWIEKTLTYVSLAASGGAIGHLMRVDGKPKTIGSTLIETAGAGFVGYLVFQLCAASNLSPEWTGIVVGTSGFLGANATIGLLRTIVSQKFGIAKKEDSQ